MKKIGYIYKITCLINNRCYVGSKLSSVFVENYWSSSKNEDYWNDLKLYGKNNFDRKILCWCKSKEELRLLEEEYILKEKALVTFGGYNLYAHVKQIIYTDEIRTKMREKRKNYFSSDKWLKENKQKFAEYKRKQVLNPNSTYQSNEYKEKMRKICTGRKHTEETKLKMCVARIGKTFSEETLKKMSESRKGKYKLNHWWNNGKVNKFCKECPGKEWIIGRINFETNLSKPVLCIETGVIYKSATEAIKILNYKSPCHIHEVCRGERKIAYGYHWKYVMGEPV